MRRFLVQRAVKPILRPLANRICPPLIAWLSSIEQWALRQSAWSHRKLAEIEERKRARTR